LSKRHHVYDDDGAPEVLCTIRCFVMGFKGAEGLYEPLLDGRSKEGKFNEHPKPDCENLIIF